MPTEVRLLLLKPKQNKQQMMVWYGMSDNE